jgi:DUF917 family protein
MRQLKAGNLDASGLGTKLLETDGGDKPYPGRLIVPRAIEHFGPVTIVDPRSCPRTRWL